jgi:uncharacterized protein (AIM24 family)
MVEQMDRALRGEEVAKPPEPPPKQERFSEIEASEVVKPEGEPPQVELMAEEMDEAPPPAEAAGGNHALHQQDWSAQLPEAPGAPAEAQVDVDVEVEAFSEEAMAGAAAPKPEQPAAPAEVKAEVKAESEPPPSAPAPEERAPEIELGRAEVEAEVEKVEVESAQRPAQAAREPEGALALPIAQLAPALQAFPADLQGPFAVRGDLVAMVCRDQMLMRLAGLVAMTGSLELESEAKRFRGRATDKPFGEGELQMVRAVGRGTVVVHAGKRTFVSMELNEESGYFQEDQVFAFEEALAFENGRVPSDSPPDLDLVHLRGVGRVLLALQGPLRSLQVELQRPVIVPMQHLVGWYGNLTPRIAPLLPDPRGKPTRIAVELSGEGFALIAVPVV